MNPFTVSYPYFIYSVIIITVEPLITSLSVIKGNDLMDLSSVDLTGTLVLSLPKSPDFNHLLIHFTQVIDVLLSVDLNQ